MDISLTKGQVAIVDEDFESSSKWYAQYNPHTKSWYARTSIMINGKQKGKLMHRVIMGAKTGELVDHINHNTLDNRRSNLRLCTVRQNSFNRKLYGNNTSGYKGVFLRKESGQYRAGIRVDNKMHWRGGYDNAIDAAIAYNDMAKELHGEHANINIL
jgi:hypothetical protein